MATIELSTPEPEKVLPILVNVVRRVVTYGDGWMPWVFTPEQIRQGRAILNDLASKAGRDPKSIEVVAAPVPAEPEAIKAFEEAGADAALMFMLPAPEQDMLDELEHMARKALT